MDFGTTVKLTVYETIAETAVMPTSVEIATRLGRSQLDIEMEFQALAAKRLLVLEPGSTSHIRMASPFSGIDTAFPVQVGEKIYFSNCIWDAFGVAAALHADATIPASDGHSGEPLTLEVRNSSPVAQDYVAHFAVPAAKWWDNIIYT